MKFLPFLLVLSFSLCSCFVDQGSSDRLGDRDLSENPRERKRKKDRVEIETAQLGTVPLETEQEKQTAKPLPHQQETPKNQARPQAQPQPEAQQPELLSFPFVLNSEHTSLSLSSLDKQNTKISVSATPESNPMHLIAGLSGVLSIKTVGARHIITITAQDRTLYFELSRSAKKIFFAEDGDTINREDSLAETLGAVTFYVKEGEKLTELCLSVNNLAEKIKVNKNFAENTNCN